MAECIVGDIAPADNISKAEKHRREEASDNSVGIGPQITWLGKSSDWQLLDLLPGSDETTGRPFARWTQAGHLWTVGGTFYSSLVFADYLRMMELSENICMCASVVGVREPEQPRGPPGQRVWPSGDDPPGSRVRGTGGDARKTAGVLWLHQRYV